MSASVLFPPSVLGQASTAAGHLDMAAHVGGPSASTLNRRNWEAGLILSRASQQKSDLNTENDELKRKDSLTALDFRLRREERRSRLFRASSFRSSGLQDSEKKEENKIERDKQEDSEETREQAAKNLDQWVKKMKCNGSIASLSQFRDIKVGVYGSEVIPKSPSHEPYEDLSKESFTYSGGKDAQRNFHGKGTVEFDDGSFLIGYWVHGLRHGDFKVETNRNNVCFLDGEYRNDKLNGKGRIHFNDYTWLEGFFKDGVLHGFCRYFDQKNRLRFLGMHRNGKPFGTCWKIIEGGGCVVGCVDEEGKLSGGDIAYLYPDLRTAIRGTFQDGELKSGYAVNLKGASADNFGIMVPHFTEPYSPDYIYRRELSTYTFMTSTPMIPDPYEMKMIEVKKSKVPGANDGLFAKKEVQPNTVLAFYHGVKIDPNVNEEDTWEMNAYKIFDPSVKNGTLDIPENFRDKDNYRASLAHKTNHSFVPNSEFMVFNHPRFGKIPCIASIHTIAQGEEIFVRYGYELNYCPAWYLEAWENGNYPVPDSMKAEYGSEPAWASTTNEDRANQLPEHVPVK